MCGAPRGAWCSTVLSSPRNLFHLNCRWVPVHGPAAPHITQVTGLYRVLIGGPSLLSRLWYSMPSSSYHYQSSNVQVVVPLATPTPTENTQLFLLA